MIRRLAALLPALLPAGLLAACAATGVATPPFWDLGSTSLRDFDPAELEPANVARRLQTDLDRAYEQAYLQAPFVDGAVAVVTTENEELRTFPIVACRENRALCEESSGRAGTLTRTPDFFVVDGLYGRRFWLSYAGDGYVERGGHLTPLAWGARPDGTGTGAGADVETPAPHG